MTSTEYVKPKNITQLEAMIKAGHVEVLDEAPPNVAATLSEYEHLRGEDRRVFRFIPENKYGFVLKCVDCGAETRVIRTSDAFQAQRCLKCTAAARRERAKARRAEVKAALAKTKD